jgi:hypothetical protein
MDFDDLRYYVPYAIKALLAESITVGATALLFYQGNLLAGIQWEDAPILVFYLLFFMALAVPAYWVIKAHPDGPEPGARVLQIALLIAFAATWIPIKDATVGWCVWLALLPSAWMTIDYKRLLRAEEKRANRSSYEKTMDEFMGR